jgi:hypothetical protein
MDWKFKGCEIRLEEDDILKREVTQNQTLLTPFKI